MFYSCLSPHIVLFMNRLVAFPLCPKSDKIFPKCYSTQWYCQRKACEAIHNHYWCHQRECCKSPVKEMRLILACMYSWWKDAVKEHNKSLINGRKRTEYKMLDEGWAQIPFKLYWHLKSTYIKLIMYFMVLQNQCCALRKRFKEKQKARKCRLFAFCQNDY